MENYYFEYQKIPLEQDHKVLLEGINQEASLRQLQPVLPFGIYLKDSKETILGGVFGHFIHGSFHTDMLWLAKEIRQKGWGRKLMREAEAIAREKKCRFATVNTMDWEALPFYLKLGYQIDFTREGYDNKSKMYSLRKKLSD